MTEHTAPRTLEEALESFWKDAKAIMLAKRRLRGHENISAQGLYGVVTRVVEDKMARIKRTVGDMDLRARMQERGIPQDIIDEHVPRPANEAGEELEDDFIDAANYYIIAWLLWQDWWTLPLASDLRKGRSEDREIEDWLRKGHYCLLEEWQNVASHEDLRRWLQTHYPAVYMTSPSYPEPPGLDQLATTRAGGMRVAREDL